MKIPCFCGSISNDRNYTCPQQIVERPLAHWWGSDDMSKHSDAHRAVIAEARALAAITRQHPRLAVSVCVLSEINKLTCNAKTRPGGRCRRTDLAENGRCRFHGGASTGPKTQAGKERACANLALRWANHEPKEKDNG